MHSGSAIALRDVSAAAREKLFFLPFVGGSCPLETLQMGEGNRPKGITAVLKAPVGVAGWFLGPLSSQPEAEGQRPLA